ncbi:hypothetical protein [Tunturibacter empetritectus]|uniref:Uncharacterized protein n=1 Tax=Tunturiibacter lichenicola TaxID=2051959 RepID=A0A7W8J569_9BACT|nr:hypothetical protein [Edaphobacter lichenicola]MBB5342849.1 hypothetical protein [Edaphobacter lichenicola]
MNDIDAIREVLGKLASLTESLANETATLLDDYATRIVKDSHATVERAKRIRSIASELHIDVRKVLDKTGR